MHFPSSQAHFANLAFETLNPFLHKNWQRDPSLLSSVQRTFPFAGFTSGGHFVCCTSILWLFSLLPLIIASSTFEPSAFGHAEHFASLKELDLSHEHLFELQMHLGFANFVFDGANPSSQIKWHVDDFLKPLVHLNPPFMPPSKGGHVFRSLFFPNFFRLANLLTAKVVAASAASSSPSSSYTTSEATSEPPRNSGASETRGSSTSSTKPTKSDMSATSQRSPRKPGLQEHEISVFSDSQVPPFSHGF